MKYRNELSKLIHFFLKKYIICYIIKIEKRDKMLVSIIIISLVGTFLHFLYEISNHNKIVALFAAVNEST